MMAFEPETLTLEALRAATPPDFIERRPEVLTAWYVKKFEELSGHTLYPAQTEMFIIEVMAYAKSVIGEAIQSAFLQNRAVWATGRHLEEIGANVSTFKLKAQPARIKVRATLPAVQASALTLPHGASLSAGNRLFALDGEIVIPAGQATAEGAATALEAGAAGNGFQPGQIGAQAVIDGQPVRLENLDISAGGADIEEEEAYRERVVDALERVSKAGPRQGYIQLVKQVSPEIIDVDPKRTQPGHIQITPLTKTGAASNALDAAILEWLDPEIRVPMGDYIVTAKAVPVVFNVALSVRIRTGAGAALTPKIEAVTRALFARFGKKLGAHVSAEALRSAVLALEGVIEVEGAVGYAFTALASNQFAQLGTYALNLTEVA